ncbi:MAG: zf-HC2 domain-containing protein [Acidobacteriota bacterium]|nr:zf-HC2 domain-containing protein [Acidobacteriota bacterium]
MNVVSPHIPFTTLVDLAEGRLTAEGRTKFEAHLSGCSRCAAQVARIEQTIELMSTDASEEAPGYLLASAVHLFRKRAAGPGALSGVRRILAALSFDSEQRSPAFGVRSGQPAPTRRLLFKAEENDVDIRIKESGEGWIVSGQVFGECSGAEAELRGAIDVRRGQLNESCEFTLPVVSAGIYTLRLRLGGREIEIPDLELG